MMIIGVGVENRVAVGQAWGAVCAGGAGSCSSARAAGSASGAGAVATSS
jgi:hypothetical protein